MKLSESIRSVSYLKAHAAELLREVSDSQGTLIITQNGEARAVLQDIHAYEEMQETLAMLKVLAQSERSARAGKLKPARQAFKDIRRRAREHDGK